MKYLTGLNLWMALTGFAAFVLPLVDLIFVGKKISWKGILLISVGIATMILAIAKGRDDEKNAAENKIAQESLRNEVKAVKMEISKHNILFKQFIDSLESKFHIKRDTITNMPIKTAFFIQHLDNMNVY